MEGLLRVVGFALFLALYASYTLVGAKIVTVVQSRATKGQSSLLIEVALGSIVFVIVFIWIYVLTGFISLPMAFMFAAVTGIGAGLALLTSKLLSTPEAFSRQLIFWTMATSPNNFVFGLISLIAALLLYAVYPIAVAVAYFGSAFPPPDGGLHILRLTMVLFAVGYWVTATPASIRLLVSPYIDEDTRVRVLVSAMSALISMGLFLGIAFWSMSPTAASGDLGPVPWDLSIELVAFLMAFFLVSAVGPYWLGVRRGRELRLRVRTDENEWLNWIEDALPLMLGATSASEIDLVENELRGEIEAVSEAADPARVDARSDGELEELVPLSPPLARAGFQAALESDPRLAYRRALQGVLDLIETLRGELAGRRNRDFLTVKWLYLLDRRRRDVDHRANDDRGTRVAGLVISGGLFLAGPLLDRAVNWGWEMTLAVMR